MKANRDRCRQVGTQAKGHGRARARTVLPWRCEGGARWSGCPNFSDISSAFLSVHPMMYLQNSLNPIDPCSQPQAQHLRHERGR